VAEEPQPRNGARDVEHALAELTRQVAALRADVGKLSPGRLPEASGAGGWDDDAGPDAHAWLDSVSPPAEWRPAIPRWIPEVAFLVAVAVVAAVADLDALVIAACMTGAWVVVALVELAAARAERSSAPMAWGPAPVGAPPQPADPSWFQPPVERTMLHEEQPDHEHTITRLPPQQQDTETTVEHRPG
jgi:hypothetical protein